jgi:hypothetical protein
VSGTAWHKGGKGRLATGPGCGGARSGDARQGKTGGPVKWLLWAGSGRKGSRLGEKEKKWAQPRMNSADFDLSQIFKLI